MNLYGSHARESENQEKTVVGSLYGMFTVKLLPQCQKLRTFRLLPKKKQTEIIVQHAREIFANQYRILLKLAKSCRIKMQCAAAVWHKAIMTCTIYFMVRK